MLLKVHNKSTYLSGSISKSLGAILNIKINWKSSELDNSLCILIPCDIRAWRSIDIKETNAVSSFLFFNGESFENHPLDIVVENIANNRFKVQMDIKLPTAIEIEVRSQGRYGSVSIKEDILKEAAKEGTIEFSKLIDVNSYLVNEPTHQFNGALGFRVKT